MNTIRPVASLVLLVCLASACPAAEADNLAPNPGFEDVDDQGVPTGWSCPRDVYSVVTDRARSGERCLRYENADPGRYRLCSVSLDYAHGRSYEFAVWVRTEDVQGEDTGATICMEWYGDDGTYLGGTYPKGIKGTQAEWTKVSGATRSIPETAAKVNVVCYVRKGMTGVAWFDDVSVTPYYAPLAEGLVSDRYRDTVADGKVRFAVGVSLDGHDLTIDQIVAELTLQDPQGKVVLRTPAAALTAARAEFVVDAGTLALGQYDVMATVAAKDGSRSCEVAGKLNRVAKLPERRVYIDRHHRLVVDGEPFFPLGTYWGGVSEEHLELYGESAFNCLMPYGRPKPEQMDLLQARGLKVIYSIKDFYAGTKWCPGSIKTEADERPAVESVVTEFRDHPALLAWYINDELPWTMVDRLTAHQRWIEELDPDHPTWVVLYQVGHVRKYVTTFDVIGTDPYPIPNRPAGTALHHVRLTRDAAFGFRPVWQVPQIFNWAAYRKPDEAHPYRAPTLLEMRSMAWQSIAGGANGLVFYSWMDLWRGDKVEPFEERWPDVKAMAAEIAKYIPVMLSVEPLPAIDAVAVPEQVAWRAWRKDDSVYLLAVNSGDAAAAATFRFPAAITETVTEIGASPAESAGREVRMRFEPLEPKMLRLPAPRG